MWKLEKIIEVINMAGSTNREKIISVTQTSFEVTNGSRINRGFMMNTQNY